MFEKVNNFPLSWPALWPRIPAHKRQAARFTKSNGQPHSILEATEFVLDELRRLGARNPIISSNMRYRADGLPYSKQSKPDDPGIAVYFALKDQPRVLACDKWTTIADNLWAIGLHIDAIRGVERWGVGTIDQAFDGYPALAAPKTAWWDVLGITQQASREQVLNAYRTLAKQNHPDAGGDQEQFLRIQQAWEQAQKEIGWL